MTRLELLQLVVARARANGFELRRWYTGRLGIPWISQEAAITLLDAQRRYYALLFSHEFAQSFWKAGADITFDVPQQTFQRTMPDGSVRTIRRKPYIRRSARANAWKYHLREMALAEEPLRYLRRYLHIEEDLTADEPAAMDTPGQQIGRPQGKSAAKKSTRAPSPELPAFLQRPYRGTSN